MGDYENDRCRLLVGDVRETLKTLPPCCVHGVITSPPYFALRSYLPAGHVDKSLELGSESSLAEYIESQVAVFREVRRVLRDDGILYMNLGDTVASQGGTRTSGSHDGVKGRGEAPGPRVKGRDGEPLNVPFRVAEALRADGWWLRQTIAWVKKSPMPESIQGSSWRRCRVKVGHESERAGQAYKGNTPDSGGKLNRDCIGGEWVGGAVWSPCPGCHKCSATNGYVLRRGRGRFTSSFEYVFLFSKNRDYFFDLEAAKEPAVGGTPGNKTHRGAEAYANGDAHMRTKVGLTNMVAAETRIPRNVWSISTEPLKQKHFAAYPSELVRRCLVTCAKDVCAACGAPHAPVVESERIATRPGDDSKVYRHDVGFGTGAVPGGHATEFGNRDPQRHIARTTITGYRPTCTCAAGIGRAVILDPYLGSGTTAQVARHFGRDWIGCELNEAYAAIARERIPQTPRCVLRLQKPRKRVASCAGQQPLFPEN